MILEPRTIALKAERVFQSSLEAAMRTWSSVRTPSSLDASYFRGRTCHCPPNLPFHGVHSEALRESCDIVIDFGSNVTAPGRMHVPVETMARAIGSVPRGTSIHLKSDLIEDFVRHVLPRLRAPIVLVSGDSDVGPVSTHRALLDDARIAHWFAQNCDIHEAHPKLTRVPIGFDNPIYTKLDKRLGFLVTMALGKTPLDASLGKNDIGNQKAMFAVRRTLPKTSARPARALATFHQNQKLVAPDLTKIPERRRAYEELRENSACHFVTQRLRQEECWRVHGDFAFEISPVGNGLDCFRTWESLLLGSIPIVRRSPLDRLYRDHGFPVVIVESYREVTQARLHAWKAEHENAFADASAAGGSLLHKLSADYWIGLVKKAQAQS